MTISANYPSIAPTLDLDFANSVALDPRISYSRSTTGTYYDGQTSAIAEQNLIKYSQGTGMAANWGADSSTQSTRVDNAAVAPDGTTTAMSFTSLGGYANMSQNVSTTAGSTYTLSFYAQVPLGTYTFSGGSAGITGTITTAWQRFTVTGTISTSSTVYLFNSVPNAQVIYVWGVQLEQRSFVTPYNVTTTAAITNYIPQLLTAPVNQPRFDFNPTTRQSLGLLMEQQSTNLITYSSQFDNAAWTKTNATVTAATNISPDGTLNAQTLNGNASNVQHFTSNTISFVNGNTYTCSIYAKNSGQRYLVLATEFTTSVNDYVVFDLQLGTKLYESNATGTITSVGNGWYRLTTTVVGGNATGSKSFYVVLSDGTSARAPSFVGSTTNGVYLWGTQVEALTFPTSYIPTVASQVTRAQDFATMTGTNFSSWFNNQQGTVYCSFDNATVSSNMTTWAIDTTSIDGYIVVRVGTGLTGYVYPSSISSGTSTATSNTTQQSAYSYNNTTLSQSIVLNGGTAGTASFTALSFQPNQMELGKNRTANIMTGHIRKFAYYPIATTATNLQALTGS